AIEQKLEEWSRWLRLCGISDESIRCRHSEKLALAYAVTQGMSQIVLRKNLRICVACHEAAKQITILESISIHHWDRSRVDGNKANPCLTRCEQYSFPAMGLQWGQECRSCMRSHLSFLHLPIDFSAWTNLGCGDIEMLPTQAPDRDCNIVCTGDQAHYAYV